MKKIFNKRVMALALVGALMVSMIQRPAHAQVGETIKGAPETVIVSVDSAYERENNFNEDWKFNLGDNSSASTTGFDDSSWTNVQVPHDFSITQNFTTSGEAESGFLPGGTGWYRKHFTLPSSYEGKKIIINFDGVYANAYVYINGTKVGENHYGYSSFAVDISDYVTCDGATENVLAVKAVNQIPSSRWYSGSGIYRDVTMIVTDPVHVGYNDVCITTPDIANGSGRVNVAVTVDNETKEAKSVKVVNTVYKSDGTIASTSAETTATTIAAGASSDIVGNVTVQNPELWSTDTPNMYFVRTEVYADGVLTDTVETSFGFRYFAFSTSGFSLNGKNLKLNGVCMHHDQGALGAAAYKEAIYRQMIILKDMGVNAIRVTHNPAAEALIEVCNEVGLLVIEEAFDGWNLAKNGNSYDFSQYFTTSVGAQSSLLDSSSSMTWAEFAIKSMVKRDRNAPSIILWSLGNEIQEGASTSSQFPSIAQNLITWIEEVDATRKTTIGDNTKASNSTIASVLSTIYNSGGIIGFNYASGSNLDSLAGSYGGVILNSETSSAVNSRGIYMSQSNAGNADGNYHLTSYDTSKVGWGLFASESMYNTLTRDFVAGEFVWTGFDYIGEPTPWNGTGSGSVSYVGAYPNSSYFGIVETTGFAKDTYYLYRSQWNQKDTTCHLVTAWDSDNMLTSSGETPVWIYSNAPIVKLYRNNTLVGIATRTEHTTSAGHKYYTYTTASNNSSICTAQTGSGHSSLYAVFNVTYEAGEIRAVACDANGTELANTVGKNSVSTPGTVTKLAASSNRTELLADGTSLAYITVDVTDANGVLDTTATNAIQVSVSGAATIAGVDNGDQATTAKYQQSSVLLSSTSAKINAYAGKALIILKSGKEAGPVTVSITSSGLQGQTLTLQVNATEASTQTEGLVSYELVRDYTVKAGNVPSLDTTATGTMADGTTVTGKITWDVLPSTVVPGDYTITGTLTFPGVEPIAISCRLHSIANVIAMRNISTATMQNKLPELPDTVKGIMADGTLQGEFSVVWDAMSEASFATVGQIVTVHGTATVMGTETLPVTASVRVAETVNTESRNVAPAAHLAQDIAVGMQSDNLASINNGTLKPGDNTSERWSNWGNRTTSDTATLTFRWDTAQMLESLDMYYYYDNCAKKPQQVTVRYSLNGSEYVEISATETLVETYNLGEHYKYTFETPINPISVQVILQQQSGTTGTNCVAVTEAEFYTFAGSFEKYSSAALSGITVDGTAMTGFAPETTSYTVTGKTIEVTSAENAGVTILPAVNDVVRIITVSEDGSAGKLYEITCEEVVVVKLVPTVSVSAQASGTNIIRMIGKFEDYANISEYYEVEAHGIIYCSAAKLGAKILTINTAGRTNLSFGSYKEDGSFAYNFKPAYKSTKYAVRAYLKYRDEDGRVCYAYSNTIYVSYNSLK